MPGTRLTQAATRASRTVRASRRPVSISGTVTSTTANRSSINLTFQHPRPVHNTAKHGMGVLAGPGVVFSGDCLHEILGSVTADKIDRRASKAAACQACPVAHFHGASQLDQQIELGGAVLEKITRTFVALKHV